MLPSYPDLMKPIRLRGVDVRNRIVFSGHATKLCEAQVPSERLRAYYVARARGGVGLIVSELVSVYPPEGELVRAARLGLQARDPRGVEADRRRVPRARCHHRATAIRRRAPRLRPGVLQARHRPIGCPMGHRAREAEGDEAEGHPGND